MATTSDDGEVLEFIGTYTVTRTHSSDGDYLTAACSQCREIVTVPDKGLGRATIGTWKTRHQHRTLGGLSGGSCRG